MPLLEEGLGVGGGIFVVFGTFAFEAADDAMAA